MKAIRKVEKWSYDWGFKPSTSKYCYTITNKCTLVAEKLTLYGQQMERENEFKHLGLWLDNKCTWKIHNHLDTKCKNSKPVTSSGWL